MGGLRSVTVVVTPRCNLACSYCYQQPRGAGSMAEEVLDAAVDLVLRSGHPAPRLVFTGGEPLLELPLIRRAVARVEGRASQGWSPVRLMVATNGTLLDDETVAFLAEHHVRTRVSLDGVEAAQEARAGGTFAPLHRTLLRLRSSQPRFFAEGLSVSLTVTSKNLPHLAKSIRLFLCLGVPRIEVGAITTPDPGWDRRAAEELERQLAVVFDLCLEHFRDTGQVPVDFLDRRAEPPRPEESGPPLCALGRGDRLVVDVDGQVAPCVMLASSTFELPEPLRTWAEPFRLGDVRDPDLGERFAALPEVAARSPLLRDRQRRVGACGPCVDCRYVAQCLPCPISARPEPGSADPERVPDPQCDLYRLTFALRERFPARPSPIDVATGKAPLPRLMEELWTAMRGRGAPP